MFATIGAPLKFCVVGDCGSDISFFFVLFLLPPFVFPGENRVLQNFPGKILQLFGLFFLHLLCLENLHGM